MDREQSMTGKQTLRLEDRHALSVDGVRQVLRFDEQSVLLHSTVGTVQIVGDGLVVHQLDSEHGAVSVSGRIDGIFYSDQPEGRTRGWRRLLR